MTEKDKIEELIKRINLVAETNWKFIDLYYVECESVYMLLESTSDKIEYFNNLFDCFKFILIEYLATKLFYSFDHKFMNNLEEIFS
jgi:hypothetical protein